jgi:hypothetical protein
MGGSANIGEDLIYSDTAWRRDDACYSMGFFEVNFCNLVNFFYTDSEKSIEIFVILRGFSPVFEIKFN